MIATIAAAGLLGCAPAHSSGAVTAYRVSAVSAAVMNAEGQADGFDLQALEMRRSARRRYHEAVEALNAGDYVRANLLLAEAEADAELSLALARRARWSAQAEQAEARLQRRRGLDARAGERSGAQSD